MCSCGGLNYLSGASAKLADAGPVRKQPHRVLAEKLVTAYGSAPGGAPRSRPPARLISHNDLSAD